MTLDATAKNKHPAPCHTSSSVYKREMKPEPQQLITTQQHVITYWGRWVRVQRKNALAGEKVTGLVKRRVGGNHRSLAYFDLIDELKKWLALEWHAKTTSAPNNDYLELVWQKCPCCCDPNPKKSQKDCIYVMPLFWERSKVLYKASHPLTPTFTRRWRRICHTRCQPAPQGEI